MLLEVPLSASSHEDSTSNAFTTNLSTSLISTTASKYIKTMAYTDMSQSPPLLAVVTWSLYDHNRFVPKGDLNHRVALYLLTSEALVEALVEAR